MNRITDYKKLQDDIVTWIKDYATTNNIKSLVVGVSGGIDSAVVSTLCCLADIQVYTVGIDINSREAGLELASIHENWLCENFMNYSKSYNISKTFNILMKEVDLEDLDTNYNSTLIEANTKSRLRMIVLHQIAQATGGIVVGTGNKVEDFGIGFYTKYGDGGVDISPIADLYKTEVRELAKYMGVSQKIIDAAPTDGLWEDGRTDEDQIGATYEELEWAMERLLDPVIGEYEECTPRQIEVIKIYRNLHRQNQHKMLPIPIYKLS